MEYFLDFFGKVVAILKNDGRGCVLDVNDIEKKEEFTRRGYIEHGGKRSIWKTTGVWSTPSIPGTNSLRYQNVLAWGR